MNFRDFIYLDTEALGRYSAQLERAGKGRMRVKSMTASVGASLGVASEGVEVAAEQASRIESSDIELFDDFERRLEALGGEEVVLLCKTTAHKSGESVVVFDPLKDFMRNNRAMRRSMKGTKELAPISVPCPVLKSDVLAIYH